MGWTKHKQVSCLHRTAIRLCDCCQTKKAYRCFIVNVITLQDVAAQNLPAWAEGCGDGQEPILLKVHSERNNLPDTCICRVQLT